MKIGKLQLIIILVSSLIVLFISCEEEIIPDNPDIINTNSIDTIKPLPYYPVYPGSWWTYQIDNNEMVTKRVQDQYQLHFYKLGSLDPWGPATYSDTVYVPFFDSKPIYGYDKIEWRFPPFGDYYMKWPILSEVIGFQFERSFSDPRYGDFSEKVKVTGKIFNGTDSILILEGHWVYGPAVHYRSYQEYKKNIGLTYEFIVDTLSHDTIYKKVLVDYFINK
jgi:hypothetical protein